LAIACRPTNEESQLVEIDLLGTEAIVHVPNALAQLVQHTGGLQRRSAGFHGIFNTGVLSSIFNKQPDCKRFSGDIHVQLMEQSPTYRASVALDITLTCYQVVSKSELHLVPETGTIRK
jgi:hypothetical protein